MITLLRLGLRTLFERAGPFEVIGEAGSVKEPQEEASRLCPDIVVMDVRLSDGNGVEACREFAPIGLKPAWSC
jgi:two-component system response regulator DevR